MRIVCSPQGIVDNKRPQNGMMDIEKAGFSEVLFDLAIGEDGISSDKLRESIVARGLSSQVVRVLPETKLDACFAEGKLFIVEPLLDEIDKTKLWQVNKEYYLSRYEEINNCVKDDRIPQILLLNCTREIHGHYVRGFCADACEAIRWIDELNETVGRNAFGFCIDIGALNLCAQNPYEYISALGSRIKAVIVRENDGQHDTTQLPFTSVAHGRSQMDWLNIFRGLREVGFDGSLVMEFKDTALAYSPMLRTQLLSFAKDIAEYIGWQIEIETALKKYSNRVLFGAGNMCRNYMKVYGKKYLPLFTCDNNKNLWGSEFCGLEVKSPDALKELPVDCAIYICNIYYREIEQQLREMGIENPIEYFNDEYMPSFYLDRIERG